jgi:hypothetical protein
MNHTNIISQDIQDEITDIFNTIPLEDIHDALNGIEKQKQIPPIYETITIENEQEE